MDPLPRVRKLPARGFFLPAATLLGHDYDSWSYIEVSSNHIIWNIYTHLFYDTISAIVIREAPLAGLSLMSDRYRKMQRNTDPKGGK